MFERPAAGESAVLVQLDFGAGDFAERLEEFQLLAGSAGARQVALVSGRSLASLEQVADLPETALLVGSHGIEIRLDSPNEQVSLDTAELAQVDVLNLVLGRGSEVGDVLTTHPAVAAVTFTGSNAENAAGTANSAAARHPSSRFSKKCIFLVMVKLRDRTVRLV